MKKVLTAFLVLVMLFSCTKKLEVVPVSEWEKFDDYISKISFKYPKNWTMVQEVDRITVYSAPVGIARFDNLTGGGADAARIIVSKQKLDTLVSLEQYVNGSHQDMTASGYDVGLVEDRTLAELPAKLFQASGHLDNRNKITSIKIFAMKDSMLYGVSYEGLNELFAAYKFVMDTVVNSLEIIAPDVQAPSEDPSIPSSKYLTFENNYLKIDYPDNFETSTPTPKAPSEFTLDIRGYRQDCYIHLDVIPAKGLTPDKVLEQNAKFYKEKRRGSTLVDDAATTYLDYQVRSDIFSRVYFLVKNDRIYRIIFNFYGPMQDKFLPAFEQSIESIKVK